MSKRLINISFNKDGTYIMFWRNKDVKELETKKFKNSFYISENSLQNLSYQQLIDLKQIFNRLGAELSDITINSINKGKLKVCHKTWPWKLGKLSEHLKNINIPYYEMDVEAKQQLLTRALRKLDLGDQEYKYLYFDIETDDSVPLTQDRFGKVEANMTVLSYAATDNENNVYYGCVDELKEEILLLNSIRDLFLKYDGIVTWNGDRFDLHILKQKFERNNIAFNWDSIVSLDYMWLYKKNSWGSRSSYSLKSIAEHEEVSKKLNEDKRKIIEMWRNDRVTLKKYNIQDVVILKELETKLGFIKLHEIQANIAHCTLQETMYVGTLIDYLMFYKSDPYFIFDNNNYIHHNFVKEKFGGGYTFCLNPGNFHDVAVFDFIGLYLSVMVSWNMSKYTKTLENNGYSSFSDTFDDKLYPSVNFAREDGAWKKILIDLKKTRDDIKAIKDYKNNRSLFLREQAIKTIGNSMYGVQGDPRKRHYDLEVANAITATARSIVKKAVKWFEEQGYVVVGGDTDSFFVANVNKDNVEELLESMNKYVSSICPEGNIIKAGLVGHYSHFLMSKKKNYAFLDKNKLKLKGFKAIKIDFCRVGSELQKKVIELIFDEKGVNEVLLEIHKTKNKVFNKELTKEDLIVTKGISRELSEYGGQNKNDITISIPLHVQLAIEDQKKNNTHVYIGKKYSFIITGRDHRNNLTGKLESEWKQEDSYDALHYWNNYILPNTIIILNTVMPTAFEWDNLLVNSKTYNNILSNENLSKYF